MIMAWLGARLVPIGAGLAILLALVAWDRARIWKAENRGAEKVVADSRAKGEKINAKNDAVRDRAGQPGAPERVLKRFCRDC